MPLMRPPPPTGANTASGTFGHWRSSSAPTVAWPAITSGSLNGCTKHSPCAASSSRACAFASS